MPDPVALVVAMDGPSGSGKSTVARGVARRLGLRYLDTGAMYRAVTWAVLTREIDPTDESAVAALAAELPLDVGTDPDHPSIAVGPTDVSAAIRSHAVTRAVSAVAAVPAVRAAMVARQRALIGVGDIVVEGRDIGTTVAPDAPVKVYLTADPVERARRRAAEVDSDPDQTQAELARRDQDDSTRTASPLAVAADAVVIDATSLTADQVVAAVLDLVDTARTRPRGGPS